MFADDCMLYYNGNNWKTIFDIVQLDLNCFVEWTTNNMLRLNTTKPQAMIVGTRSRLSKIINPEPFKIHAKDVKYVKSYNYLGIVLDSEMTLVPLCKNMEKRVVDKIFMLRKLKKYLTYKAAIQIYKQVILPIIDYAGFLMISCSKSRKEDFQIMQNDALCFCNNTSLNDRISLVKLHEKANLASLEQRRCIQLLTLMYKSSKKEGNRVVGARATRQQEKYVFRTDNKIGTKYSNSPYIKVVNSGMSLIKMCNFLIQYSYSNNM